MYCAGHGIIVVMLLKSRHTVICFYFVLYLISYAAVRTKLNVRIFSTTKFSHVSYIYTIWGAYETKTAQNINIRNNFNAKYNQITVYCTGHHSPPQMGSSVCLMYTLERAAGSLSIFLPIIISVVVTYPLIIIAL